MICFVKNLYRTNDFIPLHEPRFIGNEKIYTSKAIDSTFVSSIGSYVDDFEKKIQEITVRSNLVDYNFKVSDTILNSQSNLLKNIFESKNDFYTSSRGIDECNIVVSKNLCELVEKELVNEICINKTEKLSAISFKLPEENVSVPGIYYYVFQKLSWEGININQVISTSNEFTILVSENEVDKAFSIINRLKSI